MADGIGVMNKTKKLLEKLNQKYSNAPMTKLANEGQFEQAAETAACHGIWGIWGELRETANLPADAETRNNWIADHFAKRKAKFNCKV